MLANPQVAKIKTTKISETRILASFAKICTRENYQPYGIIAEHLSARLLSLAVCVLGWRDVALTSGPLRNAIGHA